MGKPDPSAGQMKGLQLVEDQEGDFLPAGCSVLGCQGWEELGTWGAGWTWSRFRARVSKDWGVWLWQGKNLPPPLVGGTSNVATAASLSWGWHWLWGLAVQGAWECSTSPRLWKRHPDFHHHPKRRVFLWAGQGWADSFFFSFLFISFFFFFFPLKSSRGQCLAAELGGGSWLILPGSAQDT